MPNQLPIESDWQHLIEKRSGQERRRVQDGKAGRPSESARTARPSQKPRRTRDRRSGKAH